MQIRLANASDIPAVLALHQRYHLSSIHPDDLAHGFVTTAFTNAQLQYLIEVEKGLFIACEGNAVAAYVMAASWQFWSQWPMFVHMIEGLPYLDYRGQSLTLKIPINTAQSASTEPIAVPVYWSACLNIRGNKWHRAILIWSLSSTRKIPAPSPRTPAKSAWK
ncbi:MAG: hypothetical protein NVV73_01315 [Cellvibrionaceae bacterium]|nr:hypothetical protein [Cellvibrionaceae bacterium]